MVLLRLQSASICALYSEFASRISDVPLSHKVINGIVCDLWFYNLNKVPEKEMKENHNVYSALHHPRRNGLAHPHATQS